MHSEEAHARPAGDPQTRPNGESAPPANGGLLGSEDWWAIWLGGFILLAAALATYLNRPADYPERLAELERRRQHLAELESRARAAGEPAEREQLRGEVRQERDALKEARSGLADNPFAAWFAKPGSWDDNPLDAFFKSGKSLLPGILGAFLVGLLLFGAGVRVMGGSFARFAPAFLGVFLLAVLAYVLAGQKVIKHYNLEYALWALLVGLLISNTVGTPASLRPAVRTEFYIKTGLVLLGADVLFGKLLALGVPGIFVSWVVTPIVLVGTYLFGQRVLKIRSRSLNMVISADMSVCGVSAAIATAAACRAKKEELSLAIGMSLTFTVLMMVAMPAVIRGVGMSDVLGGAWMGGTIDSTGAVAAAGGILGDTALVVASTVKMIQNVLIGVIAFAVAVYWVSAVERSAARARPSVMEIWYRFPKFVLGFVAASLVFSWIDSGGPGGAALAEAVADGTAGTLRGWFFCLAFVSIGLESNFRELARQLHGGKPVLLYVCGQSFNLALTLLMAWLMFEVVFPDASAVLTQ